MASGINERFERVLAHLDSVGDHYQPQNPASVTRSLMADFDNCVEPTQEGPMAPSAHPPGGGRISPLGPAGAYRGLSEGQYSPVGGRASTGVRPRFPFRGSQDVRYDPTGVMGWRGRAPVSLSASVDAAANSQRPINSQPGPFGNPVNFPSPTTLRSHAPVGASATPGSGVPFSVRGGEGARASTNAPSLPKMASFDARPVSQGGMRWKAFHLQFESIADRCGWSDATMRENLVLSLRGAALDFYADLPEEDQDSYRALVRRLKARFGREEAPLVKRMKLQEVQQTPEEDLDAFAERVLRLAYGAYEGLRMESEAIEAIAVNVMLAGCADRNAAATVMNRDPQSMDRALRLLYTAETTNRVLAQRQGRPRVRFERSPEPRVRRSTVEEDVKLLKEQMSSLRTEVSEMKSLKTEIISEFKSLLQANLPALTGASRQQPMLALEAPRLGGRRQSPSPARSPTGRCYECGERGHLARECPRRPRGGWERSNRKVSPSPVRAGSSPPITPPRSRSPSPALN